MQDVPRATIRQARGHWLTPEQWLGLCPSIISKTPVQNAAGTLGSISHSSQGCEDRCGAALRELDGAASISHPDGPDVGLQGYWAPWFTSIPPTSIHRRGLDCPIFPDHVRGGWFNSPSMLPLGCHRVYPWRFAPAGLRARHWQTATHAENPGVAIWDGNDNPARAITRSPHSSAPELPE